MRVLICGSRDWTDIELIRSWIAKLQDWGYSTVIEGEARGADSIARNEANKAGMIVMKFPANWDKYGKSAGPIRNTQMLVEGKPDLVVAFHNNIQISKGTKNMIKQAEAARVKVILVEE